MSGLLGPSFASETFLFTLFPWRFKCTNTVVSDSTWGSLVFVTEVGVPLIYRVQGSFAQASPKHWGQERAEVSHSVTTSKSVKRLRSGSRMEVTQAYLIA